jgi:hypothetical protein
VAEHPVEDLQLLVLPAETTDMLLKLCLSSPGQQEDEPRRQKYLDGPFDRLYLTEKRIRQIPNEDDIGENQGAQSKRQIRECDS